MLVLLLLIAWPVLELFVIVKVADAIGVLVTLLALIASWPVGLWLMRAEGRAAWNRLAAAIAAGRPPGREVLDGTLVLLGGALLIVPGFITDVLGLLLLLPPTRSLARTGIMRNLQSRLIVTAARFGSRGRPYDVDSTATETDRAHLPR